jgi:fructokinase
MILCCGEALIDMIPFHTDTGQTAYVPHTGGAIFNTAIALGRLGIPVGMLTGLSTDLHGQAIEADLKASFVDPTFSIRSRRPTTLAFVQLENGQADYTFYDENSAGRMIGPHDLPTLPETVNTLYCGGISLVVEPAAEAYAALIEQYAGTRPIMVDPNIRPGFITDEVSYRVRLSRIIAACDILKVSDEDLAWLVPGSQSLCGKVAAISGPSIVIVTEGGTGATAYLADGTSIHVPAQKVTVVDTVGAGDTFNAGFLARLFQAGLLRMGVLQTVNLSDLRNALLFAHQVAAVTVSRVGANPPHADEIPGAAS